MNKKIEIDKQFHQTRYVEFLLSHPEKISSPKDYFLNIRLLVLYARDKLDLKPARRRDYIYDLLKQNNPNFNEVVEYKKIDKILRSCGDKKHRLIDCDSIYLYQSEFDYINNLQIEKNAKKLLFTILFFWKLRNQIYKISEDNLYIPNYVVTIPCLKRESKIILKNGQTIGFLFYDLRQLGLIDYTPYKKGGVIANFIKEMPKDNYGTKVEIVGRENIGTYFEYFLTLNKFRFCANCGSIFRLGSRGKHGGERNTKYCPDCREKEIVKLKLIRCEECGEAKFISTRARRTQNLCDECYEKNRQNKKNKTVKKISSFSERP